MEETQAWMQALLEGAGVLTLWDGGEEQSKEGDQEEVDRTKGLQKQADEKEGLQMGVDGKKRLQEKEDGKEAGCNGNQARPRAGALKAEILQQVSWMQTINCQMPKN